MERVYCVVRCESFEVKSHVSKAVLWLRQLEVRSRSQLSPGEICAGQDGAGADFLLVHQFCTV